LSNTQDTPVRPTPKIEPAEGKLGILIPGMGAVATTFIAGVEAIKQNLAKPIGSTTQLATIRLGKRTDNNTPDQGLRSAGHAGRSGFRRLGYLRRKLL
jgi:myo-inositol-1-phosphate synthase